MQISKNQRLMEDLKKFIKKNNILFTDGRRNQDMVTFVGYALFKKATKEQMEETLKGEFKKSSRTKEEFERVYPFAKANKYGNWWKNVKVVDHEIVTGK